MTDFSKHLSRSHEVANKVTQVLRRRADAARQRFTDRVRQASGTYFTELASNPVSPWEAMSEWSRYGVDFAQRSVLFWDTLRQRGNQYLEHEREGLPPVLHFQYETLLDGRQFERPVNYALLRIIPPEGVLVDPKRRPYVIIDPRAGHGAGIGGFKDDSQVGVALRDGHPVYFVMFFQTPEPGQTLLDVCTAEARFVRRVRELHPDSPKPAIVGNCQGGWAAMMLAAAHPEDMGPIVINGAPMSYWGGAWSEGEGDNPMRYSGGALGGTWLASMMADLGNGVFDGAWLIQNFENLNPANTLWGKFYHVFSNVDTEPPRFLEFERWWGGFYLMNKEEIEWITQNLFVGNKLWEGDRRGAAGQGFDLREVKSPIVLFASMGDNITPPQQAFNWVADIYESTYDIKARGQVIVGLLHEDVGHLGIFVSGKVARREHAQIVSVLKSIEALPPGLYGMEILETRDGDGEPSYDVRFVEKNLEEVCARLNRFRRADEKPFKAVAALSEFNQRAYELFAQPLVQAFSNDYSARLSRELHPLRVERWAWSDLNPMTAWLAPAAEKIKAERKAVGPDSSLRRLERMQSELIRASLDLFRDVRDAVSEAAFFQVYGNMFSLYLADNYSEQAPAGPIDPRELPVVREALAAISRGGYAEAVARLGSLLAADDQFLPLANIELKRDLMAEYADYLPDLPQDLRRRVRGEQDIIVRYAREQAIATLPELLADPDDRARFLDFMELLRADQRLIGHAISDHDVTVIAAVRHVLGAPALGPAVRPAPARRAAAKRVPATGKTERPVATGRASPRRTGAGRKPRT
jgi:pimeloyl-ACP methyl ester carboxylesterase